MEAPPRSAAPRWPSLLTLSVLVLAAHLWLLTGGFVPSWGDGRPTPSAASAQVPADDASPRPTPARDGAAHPERPRILPVSISHVRWIAPPTPATPEPPPPPPATPRPVKPLPEPPAAPPGNAAPAVEPRPVATAPDDRPAPTNAPTSDPGASEPLPEAVVALAPPAPVTPEAPPPPPATAQPARTPPEPTALAKAQAPVVADAAPRGGPPATGVRTDVRLPASVELLYDIRGQAKGLNYSADARLRWQSDGARYEAELEISAFLIGSRVQTSRGRVGPGGLSPERFGDRRRSTEKAAHFDTDGQRIRFSNNASDAPLLPGAQDRLSVFLQLAGLLNARPQAYADGSRLNLQVAGTGSAEEWRFQIGPLQNLSLPAGQVSARKLTREPRHEHDSRIDVWLAPGLQHLPVRIRVTEPDGSVADQQLQLLPPLPSPPTSPPAQPLD